MVAAGRAVGGPPGGWDGGWPASVVAPVVVRVGERTPGLLLEFPEGDVEPVRVSAAFREAVDRSADKGCIHLLYAALFSADVPISP